MPTQCTKKKVEFKGLPGRNVEGRFNAGRITSDAGGLLLREVANKMDLFEKAAGCFTDYRDAGRVEHSLEELLAQRVFGLALGYEDLNDHDELRGDALLATLAGKDDPSGRDRPRERDQGKALAGKSTLNRLEWAPEEAALADRYHQMTVSLEEFEQLFARLFVEGLPAAPRQGAEPEEPIILDLDATDNPLHGKQEGRFYHGYYSCYCYLPLYIFCGEEILCAKLRRSNIDASADSLPEIKRIVEAIRQKWPEVEIILRADSGFARNRIMAWCEENEVDYVFGLAKNKRLGRRIEDLLEEVKKVAEEKEEPVRRFTEFAYSTLESWSKKRRVVAKAEHIPGKSNPRFVVTSLTGEDHEAKELYEELYCARGEMENRIKEKQLGLFADRTSAQEMRVNQIRLWLSSLAYVLISRLRRWGLRGTKWAKLQARTLRAKLLKIGALVSVSVRRVYLRMTTHYPYQQLFRKVLINLRGVGPSG